MSSAQELTTNAQVFEILGLDCLGEVPHGADSLTLIPPSNLPYLTSALIQHWQQQGTELFATDPPRTSEPYYSLSWEISRATITYTRAGRKTLSRSADLDLRYSFLGMDGEFLAHDSCQRAFSDRIPKGIVEQLESPAYSGNSGGGCLQIAGSAATWNPSYWPPRQDWLHFCFSI